MLKEFERGLTNRLKSLNMPEFNLTDDIDNENNLQFGHNMQRMYSLDDNNQD